MAVEGLTSYSWDITYDSQELARPYRLQPESLNSSEVAFIECHNIMAPGRDRQFKHHIVNPNLSYSLMKSLLYSPLRRVAIFLSLLLFAEVGFDRMVTASERPNVVVVLADDLGWGDLGCYGAELHETPHLDRFARRGLRFTQAYAMSVCSPTRATLMTGRHAARLGITVWIEASTIPTTTPPRRPRAPFAREIGS